MLLPLNETIFLKNSFNLQNIIIPMFFSPFYFLRPRKKTQRVDRCRTKKQYKNRRHFKGFYYRWMGSY
ncbi:hypothetical protein PFAG_03977 [Plasmodium falciparum Santa Lucia]|uniref:Uncharacterized protein n=12 Tax=Plasmodium falciparum TaxID=5833 RepID=C6S3K9_PLAF7|nr:conserved protein, unknown function [Plasmodium falciparum 3D7]ETW17436.1 hypothetical protein PFFVO_03587 [Plasmodium falciparum Vietnam Oak-Knoll (FVO)]ETW29962.1 hypothetical protein PFFCH_02622 [Plasmodium falciparum FCH/4]ETW35371.1 hypothetical protein PFTANZ_03955 [Plasmodium falciparum Tanzania (2000708)]ETW41488.1 hypothetical protein PFNF135_04135 [Plasmodium falciparum NF135/5.C10]ETW48165.1 hypothetical protein PFMALIP_03870 [Plasmodium falciparum MaliPS096_E11]ETW56008.1 hypot|eukprot:XP_002585485.1 conserved Plasmodium protein, unknown function [Plasmodium falciparum 3D7]